LVTTAVKFLFGFAWFGFLFGKQWQSLTGISQESMKAGMPKAIATDLITTFIMAWVLVHAVHYAGALSWGQGAMVGFFNWLGFIGAPTLAAMMYEKRPLKLYLINNAYQLISLLIMGAIVAVWV
jgi:hypothetical protein